MRERSVLRNTPLIGTLLILILIGLGACMNDYGEFRFSPEGGSGPTDVSGSGGNGGASG